MDVGAVEGVDGALCVAAGGGLGAFAGEAAPFDGGLAQFVGQAAQAAWCSAAGELAQRVAGLGLQAAGKEGRGVLSVWWGAGRQG